MMRSLTVTLLLMVATAAPGRTEAGSPTSAFETDTEPMARGRIDELVLGRLNNWDHSRGVCSDGVFVRRVYLDVTAFSQPPRGTHSSCRIRIPTSAAS